MHKLIGAGLALATSLVLAASAAASDTVVVDRADYFTDAAGGFVSVEARGDDASAVLTAHLHVAAGRTRTVRLKLPRGARVGVATLRLRASAGKLHRTTTRSFRLVRR